MSSTKNVLLTDLLSQVSRSFYLTLRVLPGSVRPQIGLAYLLARTSDTIADTQLVPVDQRVLFLQTFRDRIEGANDRQLEFGKLAQQQSSIAERRLLENADISLALLKKLSPADLEFLREVLGIIISGQELDVRRFASASASQIVPLRSHEELDDYTYRVAGCVGEFWTRICRAHVFPKADINETALLSDSVRFGKGLQLVNILRDLPADLRLGRCYLPEEKLRSAGLKPADLLQPANETQLRPVYDFYLGQAEEHLRAGWAYTNTLPRSSVRVRLACAWPILIGLRTINLLQVGNALDPQRPAKVSRREVRRSIWRSVVYYPWPSAWRRLAQ